MSLSFLFPLVAVAVTADPTPFADAWASAIWRASWQGGLALALAWLLTRAVPSLPARLRCWLWRLAYLKLLATLLWASPVRLPLLPSPQPVGFGTQASTIDDGHVGGAAADPPPAVEPPSVLPSPARPGKLKWSVALLAAWSAGVVAMLTRLALGWREARRLRSRCRSVDDVTLLRACKELSDDVGLPRPPLLATPDALVTDVVASDVDTPLLLGPLGPTIVLPRDARGRYSLPQLRLMLAHELAHLKRADLWWNWLPAAAQSLFFFHPLTWLAAREWRLAQETACDEAAVHLAGARPAEYGDMLLDVLSSRDPCRPVYASLPATAAAGVVESRVSVRRRLAAMKHFSAAQEQTFPRRRWLARALVSVAAALCVAPLTLVARDPSPARSDDEVVSARLDAPARESAKAAADTAGGLPGGAAPGAAPAGAIPGTPADAPASPLAPAAEGADDMLPVLAERSFIQTDESELAVPAEGIVSSLHAEEGESVKAGALLLRLDPARAEAELQGVMVDVELARTELQRRQAMFKKNQAVNEIEIAESELKLRRAEAVMAVKRSELDQTRIVAPFDGVVERLKARPGVFLARGTPALKLVGVGRRWADVNVRASSLPLLRKGDKAEVTVLAEGAVDTRTFTGRITFISPTVRSGSQSGTVRVQLDATPEAAALRPGTQVMPRFLVNKPQAARN